MLTNHVGMYFLFVLIIFRLPPKKPIPIGINNSLPSVSLILGILEDDERKIRILVDIGVAMNTGNLRFYM